MTGKGAGMRNRAMGLRCRPGTAFALLVSLHFTVDFFGGLLTPLLEPTLTTHWGLTIGAVAGMVGGWALLINLIQPLSGWLLPRRGMPGLLLAAPMLAASVSLIGLTTRVPAGILFLAVSGIGIGMLHPEAALAVHGLNAQRAGAAVGLFMAVGYFGFAVGGIVAGFWAEAWALRGFWLLSLPVFVLVLLCARAGLHRLEGHVGTDEGAGETERGLGSLLVVAAGVAVCMCLLVRLVTLLLVRRFPDAAGQGWGGTTVFATGITGAAGAFLWGLRADRRGPMRVLTALNLAAIPFLALLIYTPRIGWAPIWGLGLGATIGSAFPLVVVRARRTQGFSPRLRMGLTIGGAWGTGEGVFILVGLYLNRFPAGDPRPVEQILWGCIFLLLVNAGLARQMTRRPEKTGLHSAR